MKRMKTHADDDHDGEVKENVLSIFDKLSSQEKQAILEEVVDTRMGEEIEEDEDSMKTEIELMKAKDEIKRASQTRLLFIILAIGTMSMFFAFGILSAMRISDADDMSSYFNSLSTLLGVLFSSS